MPQHPRAQPRAQPRLFAALAALACVLFSAAARPAAPPTPAARPVRTAPQRASMLVPLWRRPVVRVGMQRRLSDSLSTPAISARHQRVLVGTGEGFIYALHLDDGHVLWRRSYRAPMVSQATLIELPAAAAADASAEGVAQAEPGVAPRSALPREAVVLGASDGTLLAVDVTTGALIWKAELEFEVTAAPTYAAGKLFVTSESNQVVALEAATGKPLWSQSRPSRQGLTMQGHARATVTHDLVLCSFSDGFAMALSQQTGQILWSRPLSLRPGSFIDADATPVVADGHVFVASLTDGIYALTLDGGETAWHHAVTDVVSLVHTGNILFAADTQGNVYLLDPTTGRPRNQVHLDARPAGALVDLGDAVALTGGPLGLILLSPVTGKPLGTQSMGGMPGGELAYGHGHVAHLTRSGHVMLWSHTADMADSAVSAPASPGARTR